VKTMRFLTPIFLVAFLTQCASRDKTLDFQDQGALDSFDIVKAIRNARSKADHEAIADYYRKETATYLSKASLHQNLAEWYWAAYDHPTATRAGSADLMKAAGHCTNLGRLNNRIAEHYLFLAQEHQELAEERANESGI
jgi:hypothetical protein